MYPDVVVTCVPLASDDDRVPEPMVVVEVLSPTTERHGRIPKWREYQRIGSLRHFVVIEQKERRTTSIPAPRRAGRLRPWNRPRTWSPSTLSTARLSLEAIYQDSGR